MSVRMRVLAAMWVAAFAYQAFPAMRECAASGGPHAALDLAANYSVTWAVAATVVAVVVGVAWLLATPDAPPDEPTAEPPAAS